MKKIRGLPGKRNGPEARRFTAANTSIPILTETARKLKDKFQWDDQKIADAVRHISAIATIRKPEKRLAILADAPDNRILECAVDADAELIVTGDKHLLKLGTYEDIKITTLAGLLKMAG